MGLYRSRPAEERRTWNNRRNASGVAFHPGLIQGLTMIIIAVLILLVVAWLCLPGKPDYRKQFLRDIGLEE